MSTTNHPSIAILGAGIGGLGLAIGLLKQNVSYTIYESAKEFSVVGSGVGLGPNANSAMKMLDPRFLELYDGIKTGNRSPEKYHDVFDALTAAPGFGVKEGWNGAAFNSPHYTRTSAHRKALLDVMVSFIPLETVKFNKRAKKVTQVGHKVHVLFADGETIIADAVIGGDGIKGVSREAVLGEKYPEKVEPAYAHAYGYRGIVPIDAAWDIIGELAGNAVMWMGQGRNLTCYPISHGKELNMIAMMQDAGEWDHEAWTHEVTKEFMLGQFKGCDERLIKLLDKFAKPVQWGLFHHVDTPTFYKGSICLIGDAAHATTPHQAAGGGQALEDAVSLALLLGQAQRALSQDVATPSGARKAEVLEAAFKSFETVRIERANKVVRTSIEAGKIYTWEHPESGSDMEKVVKVGNPRLPWVWVHDLEEDARLAAEMFGNLIVKMGEKGGVTTELPMKTTGGQGITAA